MILSKAYDEIMEKIVVNDDMRCRILQNLEKQMTDEASNTWEEKEKRQHRKRRYRISKYLSAAA